MSYLDVELEDIKTLRRFFTGRQSLITAGTHIKLHTLRIDHSMLGAFKATDVSQSSVTYVDELEDDDDYNSDLEEGTMTDGATEFEDAPDEEDGAAQQELGGGVPLNEDLDELEDDADDDSAVELASVSVGQSDDDDDDEDVDGDNADTPSEGGRDEPDDGKMADGPATGDEEDELASNASDEDGEQWLLKHVDVLEAIHFDWRLENP